MNLEYEQMIQDQHFKNKIMSRLTDPQVLRTQSTCKNKMTSGFFDTEMLPKPSIKIE